MQYLLQSLKNDKFTSKQLMPILQKLAIQAEIDDCSPVMEMQDVVNRLEIVLHNSNTFYTYAVSNTLNLYYRQIIEGIVLDLTVIPVNQEANDEDPIDTELSVYHGMLVIATKLADVFGMYPNQVEQDLYARMNTFPVDDIRISQWKQHTNALH